MVGLRAVIVLAGLSLATIGSAAAAEPSGTRAIYGLERRLLGGRSVAATVRWLRRQRFDAVFGGYRDPALRRALKRAGIKVYASLSLFVGRHHWKSHPESRPIDARGRPIPRQGWYAGVCPNQPWLRRAKLRQAAALVRHRKVDGVWLDFVRYPARWEQRSSRRGGRARYQTCFCPRCLADFAREARLRYPPGADPAATARWVLAHHRERFTAFKVSRITSFVAAARRAVKAVDPKVTLGLFGVPWAEGERGGAIRSELGQDFKRLAPHVDVLSPMVYHRMVGEAPAWIGRRVRALHRLTGKPVLPVVQVCSVPDRLSAEELAAALTAAAAPPSRGVVLFSLKHFLRERRGATWRRWLSR